jgi:biotin transporter BioY
MGISLAATSERSAIAEPMLNTVAGGVSYVVVPSGGFLEIGNTLSALLWSALSPLASDSRDATVD